VIPDPTVLGPTLAPYGAETSFAAHHRAHYAAMAAKARARSAERDWSAYDLAYVQALGVPGHEEVEAAIVLGRTRSAYLWRAPVPGAVEALRRLHQAGVPIGVVSNASGQIEATLRRALVCEVLAPGGPDDPARAVPVACVIDSEIVGVSKPDPAIFDHGLAALGGPDPSRVAYVGDSVTMDVEGAAAAGLHPVHLDPYDDWPDASWDRIAALWELLG
jgi:putative hydrolase of the HAD superfamily